eukprot:11195145-Lingulodinium_polyedra.AAC.1
MQKVRASVGSGAVATAIPPRVGSDYPLTNDSVVGATYRSATGEGIKDMGQKRLPRRRAGCLRGIRGRATK